MKKELVTGKLPYESPAIDTCDFRAEAGIAASVVPADGKTSEDFTNIWWGEDK